MAVLLSDWHRDCCRDRLKLLITIAQMATVAYEWKFKAPTTDEDKVRLLQLAFDTVHQVEPSPVRILTR